MKNFLALCFLGLSLSLAGCIVDVVDQSTERVATASGKDLLSLYFDASIYHGTFDVTGSPSDTLIADGKFSLWAPGSGTASSISQNVNMYWAIDTMHRGELVAFSEGPQKELVSIDKMSATIPAKASLKIDAASTDITVSAMKGDLNINGGSSNIDFATDGRMTLVQTVNGKISGSTGLGGSAISTSGDINVTLTSKSFESIYARDSTGNVNLHVPGGVGVSFFLATYGGNINLSYDKVAQSSPSAIQVNVNGGGKVINVATGTGTITVSN